MYKFIQCLCIYLYMYIQYYIHIYTHMYSMCIHVYRKTTKQSMSTERDRERQVKQDRYRDNVSVIVTICAGEIAREITMVSEEGRKASDARQTQRQTQTQRQCECNSERACWTVSVRAGEIMQEITMVSERQKEKGVMGRETEHARARDMEEKFLILNKGKWYRQRSRTFIRREMLRQRHACTCNRAHTRRPTSASRAVSSTHTHTHTKTHTDIPTHTQLPKHAHSHVLVPQATAARYKRHSTCLLIKGVCLRVCLCVCIGVSMFVSRCLRVWVCGCFHMNVHTRGLTMQGCTHTQYTATSTRYQCRRRNLVCPTSLPRFHPRSRHVPRLPHPWDFNKVLSGAIIATPLAVPTAAAAAVAAVGVREAQSDIARFCLSLCIVYIYLSIYLCVYVYIYIYIYICVCVYI